MDKTPTIPILYLDPKGEKAAEPLIDSLTRRMAMALLGSVAGTHWRGYHQTKDGALSGSCDLIWEAPWTLQRFETNSLAVHYLAYYRSDVPPTTIALLEEHLPNYELKPSVLMLEGWKFGEKWPQDRWFNGR